MSHDDLPPVGCVGQQSVAHGGRQSMPSNGPSTDEGCATDREISHTADAIASTTVSGVAIRLPQPEQFTAREPVVGHDNISEVRAPRRDEMLSRDSPGRRRGGIAHRTGGLVAVLGISFLAGSAYYGLRDYLGRELTRNNAIATVVERIIEVESNGCPNLKNKRSTASGPGQFLEETWVRLIRVHRPDIARRSEREILDLRGNVELAREITTRLAEQNAAKLRQHGFFVTHGTLYLAHFAGSAGAVAILSAPDSADAASIMANADATGRTSREKIVVANPFLQRFTVADLKSWADRKMNKDQRNQACRTLRQSALAMPASTMNGISLGGRRPIQPCYGHVLRVR